MIMDAFKNDGFAFLSPIRTSLHKSLFKFQWLFCRLPRESASSGGGFARVFRV